MKVYMNSGFQQFTPEELINYISYNNLRINVGSINSLKILERKRFSNKGNAIDGRIECQDRITQTGINIGRNPIGTGWQTYIPFLEEMQCPKAFGLYLPERLVGHPIVYLTSGDTTCGFLSNRSFTELSQTYN